MFRVRAVMWIRNSSIILFYISFLYVFSTIQSFTVQSSLKRDNSEISDLAAEAQTPECDCGANSVSCLLVDGKKNCTCENGYSQKFESCEECDCGPDSFSCEYNPYKTCNCRKGYGQKSIIGREICAECNCGNHSTGCRFYSRYDKECLCEFGYFEGLSEFGESIGCIECNCGLNSTKCYFDINNKKKCLCKKGYLPINNINSGITCDICDCGRNSNGCEVDENNYVSCNCKIGYQPKPKSVLDRNEECIPKGSSGKWKLPTFIVLGILGVIIIGVLVRIYYKRRSGV